MSHASTGFVNWYDILSVARDATPEEIKRAWRTMAKQYHPDTNSDLRAEDMLKLVNQAHDVLSNPIKRREFDRDLADYESGKFAEPESDDEPEDDSRPPVIKVDTNLVTFGVVGAEDNGLEFIVKVDNEGGDCGIRLNPGDGSFWQAEVVDASPHGEWIRVVVTLQLQDDEEAGDRHEAFQIELDNGSQVSYAQISVKAEVRETETVTPSSGAYHTVPPFVPPGAPPRRPVPVAHAAGYPHSFWNDLGFWGWAGVLSVWGLVIFVTSISHQWLWALGEYYGGLAIYYYTTPVHYRHKAGRRVSAFVVFGSILAFWLYGYFSTNHGSAAPGAGSVYSNNSGTSTQAPAIPSAQQVIEKDLKTLQLKCLDKYTCKNFPINWFNGNIMPFLIVQGLDRNLRDNLENFGYTDSWTSSYGMNLTSLEATSTKTTGRFAGDVMIPDPSNPGATENSGLLYSDYLSPVIAGLPGPTKPGNQWITWTVYDPSGEPVLKRTFTFKAVTKYPANWPNDYDPFATYKPPPGFPLIPTNSS